MPHYRNLSPGKRTAASIMERTMDEAFRNVAGWDKDAGNAQHRDRLDKRQAMGQKRTPLGRGTLKRN